VTAPVAGVENRAVVPWPCCQTKVRTPNAAASEMRFSSRALTGSHRDRRARASSRNVSTTMAVRMTARFGPYRAVMKSASWAGPGRGGRGLRFAEVE